MVYLNATAAPREELTDVIMEGTSDFEEFQGLALLPAQPMTLPTGHVPKITIATGDLMRATTRRRAPGTNFTRWQSSIDAANITLFQVAEEVQIPDENSLLYEDYFAFEEVYAMEASNRLRRGHELDAEATIFTTANFDAVAAGVAYTAANIATIDIVSDIIAAARRLKARGEKPNTVMIPGIIWDRARLTPLLKTFVVGVLNAGAQVTPQSLAAGLAVNGIKNILVGDGYVNQSEDLTANEINPIWPATYIFVGNVQSGALRSGGIGRTFFWEKEGPLLNASSYRDEPKKSNIIRAMKTTITQITNSRAGTLITTGWTA